MPEDEINSMEAVGDLSACSAEQPVRQATAAPTSLVGEATGNDAYQAALEYLYSRINYEKIGHAPYTSNHYRLDRMRRLLEMLDNPHHRYPVVHVAGTKGKGTVSHVVASALQANGLKTGLFTSPHLRKLEERFRIDGLEANPRQLVELTDAIRQAAERLEALSGERPTFFELTTAMALLHFARAPVDCAVIEVGLGGRLDSTNVCSPIVSVITSISLDHQQQLGDSIAKIAAEKAGIIKPGVPVVCSARHPDARTVIERVAESQGAPLRLIDREFQVEWQPMLNPPPGSPCAQLQYRSTGGTLAAAEEPRELRMLGAHQADNVAAAITVLQLLRGLGWSLDDEKSFSAIAHCQPPARLEIVAERPLSIIDTAHNPASMGAGLAAIRAHFPSRRMTAVFASSHDKDYRDMLGKLLGNCGHLILTRYLHNPRACPVPRLLEAVQELQRQSAADCLVETAESPEQAWEMALRQTPPDEILYATGSFFLAAELLAWSARGT